MRVAEVMSDWRELLVLRMILLTANDSPSSRSAIVELACQYGKYFNVTADEVETVLSKSVAAVV